MIRWGKEGDGDGPRRQRRLCGVQDNGPKWPKPNSNLFPALMASENAHCSLSHEQDIDMDCGSDCESSSSTDSEDADSSRGSSTVVSDIENMTLSFLSQLVRQKQRPPVTYKTDKRTVILKLANRTAQSSSEATTYRRLIYPRKCATGSARPFGERLYALLPSLTKPSTTLPLTGHCA